MKDRIKQLFKDSVVLRQDFLSDERINTISHMTESIIQCLQNKGKVLICGNGGSASDSLHFAGELLGRFEKNRTALAAIALNSDVATLTAISNDLGFEHIYSRQVEGIGREGDILFIISTSGNSSNLVEAAKKAAQNKIKVLGLLGRDGGKLKSLSEICLIVPHDNSARIQEIHITVIHIICDLVEQHFFGK